MARMRNVHVTGPKVPTEESVLKEARAQLGGIRDNETLESIFTILRAGGTLQDAAKFAGVSLDRIKRWYQLGKNPRLRRTYPNRANYKKFAKDVDKARIGAKMQAVGTLMAAMSERKLRVITTHDKDGKPVDQIVKEMPPVAVDAAKFVLERRYAREWGRQRLELTGANGGPIEVQDSTVPDEVLSAREQMALVLGNLAVHALELHGGRLPTPREALPAAAEIQRLGSGGSGE